MTVLRAVGLFLLAALLPACTGPENTTEAAHAVFMTRADCSYFVTNVTANRFAVLAPRDGFAPRQGDLLVGNLREGELVLAIAPFGTEEITGTAAFEVVGHDLQLAEAQRLYYGFCPLPLAPPSPGLPLAPESVPQPPDTSDAF